MGSGDDVRGCDYWDDSGCDFSDQLFLVAGLGGFCNFAVCIYVFETTVFDGFYVFGSGDGAGVFQSGGGAV